MNAWGQYSNPPSQESAEMQECRRLHNLWPKSELALPLTFKGEASMEFVDWYFQAAWDEASARAPDSTLSQIHLQKQILLEINEIIKPRLFHVKQTRI